MSSSFLVRITQIYQYQPDNVRLGAQFVNRNVGAHRVIILTKQDNLNIEPRPGQQWKILEENNFSIRQENIGGNQHVSVYRFMEPSLKCVMPDNGVGFVNFLSKEKAFKGIGKVSAQLLWDHFRSEIFSILECHIDAPYEKDGSISNFEVIRKVLLSDQAVKGLWQGYQEYANLKYAEQLVALGVEEPIQRQLFRIAHKDALLFLKNNPYRLTSLGMRFQLVDKIAQHHFGIKQDDELRLASIIEQALRRWGEAGNTVADWQDIEPEVSALLDNQQELVKKASNLEGDIIGFLKKDGKIFLSGNYIFEKTIAKRFHKLSKKTTLWNERLEDAFRTSIPKGWLLEIEQERAIRTALISHVFALTGGAGTGKTSTTNIIASSYQRLGFCIYPVALSAKAARRLQQAIGIKTMTIARLLREESVNNTNSVLIVDEASMLDASTMWRLITLFSDSTRIILIGDPCQLPPINAGFVLRDVIQSLAINHIELDVVKRQDTQSSIPAYANSIKFGLIPKSLNTTDITFQEPDTGILQTAIQAYGQYNKAIVIASTNAMVREVNNKLQEKQNSGGKKLDLANMPITKGSYEFREGDPIVITRTCYRSGVQNGTLGIIKDAVPTDEYACVIALEELDEGGNARILLVDWQLFEYLDLAYCLTLHKFQGSQAQNIIVLVERSPLLDRSWLYTAVTRAEKRVHLIGKKSDFFYGIKKSGGLEMRKTALQEMLKNV